MSVATESHSTGRQQSNQQIEWPETGFEIGPFGIQELLSALCEL